MFSLKQLVAAVALGTALLAAPSAVNAAVTHHHTASTHPIKHKVVKHKRVHRKHAAKHVALHSKVKAHSLHTIAAKSTKHISTKTGFKHHPSL